MESNTGEWDTLRKRPYSDIKPSPGHSSVRKHIRSLSSSDDPNYISSKTQALRYTPAEVSALADFRFFDDGDSLTTTRSVAHATHVAGSDDLKYRSSLAESVHTGHTTDTITSLSHSPEASESIFTRLIHPTGSPVLRRELTSNSDHRVRANKEPSTYLGQDLGCNSSHTAEEILETNKDSHSISGSEYSVQDDRLSALETSVILPDEDATISVAEQMAKSRHAVIRSGGDLRPKIVEINQNKSERIHPSILLEQSTENSRNIRSSDFAMLLPRAAQESVDDPAVSGTELLSKDFLSDSSITPAQSKLSPPSCDDVTFKISQPLLPNCSKEMSVEDVGGRPHTAAASEIVPRVLTVRPASPPLHRSDKPSCMLLEPKKREHWTLYDLSCLSDKAHLKTLLKGPAFEFRTAPDALPFLENVFQEMLTHFCGEDHVARLIRNFGLPPENPEQEDQVLDVLVFPESLVNPTAIMRIVRYMRRCCARTTTIMKPHFQLHAPPSLGANIETIRACNIFGLYADARRLQNFLTNKRIPGGKLTMEDVEIIWEGYDGGLRDSVYTDALLTHIVYNVLGSENVDREDLMVLLEQEEFAGLREMIGYELGVKKKKAEEKEDFMMRKQSERADKNNQVNGGKKLTKLEAFRARKGPMVQGRLLRVLSQDALMAVDPTLEKRYKTRPSSRKTVSTPDLYKERRRLESAGYLYQNALREINDHASVMKSKVSRCEMQKAEEKQTAPLKMIGEEPQARPTAPTPTGRKERLENNIHMSGYGFSSNNSKLVSKDIVKEGTSKLYHMKEEVGTLLPRVQTQRGEQHAVGSLRDASQALMRRLRPSDEAHSGRSPISKALADPWRSKMDQIFLQAKSRMPPKLKELWEEVRDHI